MAVILGFGQSHIDKAKSVVNELAEHLPKENTKDFAEEFALSQGTYDAPKNKFRIMRIRTVHTWEDYDEHWGCVIEGIYSCYRNDHPLSPDGFACLDIKFCLTIQEDDVWGKRVYCCIG